MKTKVLGIWIVLSFMILSVPESSSAQVDGLTPPLPLVEELTSGGNITVNFKEVDIRTVLHYLSEVGGVDIIPTEEITGSVTMRLRNKPWEVVLDVVTRTFDYAYSREGDIIRIMPKDKLHMEAPITEVIALNYIIQNADNSTSSENVGGMDKNITQLMEATAAILDAGIGEKATFLPNANAVVVTAIPTRISSIKKMISKLDVKTPQIMLEAKIIEITLDRNDQFGVDWNAVVSASGARMPHTVPFGNTGNDRFLQNYFPQNSTDTGKAEFPYMDMTNLIDPTTFTTALNTANLFSYGTMDFTTFSATLRMIDEWDDTNILSSPRITTLNNQRAVIKVIQNVFLQKQQTSTNSASVVTVEFEDDPREIGIILEVTPHVNDKQEITVDLKPQVSSTLSFSELSVSGSANTVAMTYNSREADTQVMVKDGETIFIGGLIKETTTKEDHKFPILGDILGPIPVLGGLFKYKQDNVDKTEVVFFVTVHLLKDASHSIQASNMQSYYDKAYSQECGKEANKRKNKKCRKPRVKK
ncbi:MAG: hypothetical protein ABH844_06750 [Candidatus Omnitrophota bacterium]